MEGIVGLLFAGVAASIAFLLAADRSWVRARAWRDAAKAVGLTEVEETETLGFVTGLSGTDRGGGAVDRDDGTSAPGVPGLRVRLESYRRGKHNSGTRITVGPLGHGPYGFALRRENLGTAFEKVVGEREIEIGDRGFDEELYVQGQVPLARAVLDAETRREVRRLFRGEIWGGRPSDVKARLAGDLLQVEIRERLFEPGLQELPDVLSRILAVSRRLSAPRDVAARLAANLRGEPEPRVRLECLLTLVREFAHHAATREALLAAREDPNTEVRLRAAMALGPEGRACLLELASGDAVEDSSAARAVGALGEHLERARAEEILGRALRGRRLATAMACLDTLGRWGGEVGVPYLAKVLGDETGEVGAAAARALGATGAAVAEEPLVGALASEAVDVRIAAARALGRVGSVAAVPPLRDAAERARHRELDRAVRQAVAEIQSRLEGAVPGQLSLSEAEAGAGQLSLADEDVDGRVSLVEDEEPLPSSGPPRARGREPA